MNRDDYGYTKSFLAVKRNEDEYLLKIINKYKPIKIGPYIHKPIGYSNTAKEKSTILSFKSKNELYKAILDDLIKNNNLEFKLENLNLSLTNKNINPVNLNLKEGKVYITILGDYANKDISKDVYEYSERVYSIKLRLTPIKEYLYNEKKDSIDFKNYISDLIKEYKGIDVNLNLPVYTYSDILQNFSFDKDKYKLIQDMLKEIKKGSFIFDDKKFDNVFFALEGIKYDYYERPSDIKGLIYRYKTIVFKYISSGYINYDSLNKYNKKSIRFEKSDSCTSSNIINQMYETLKNKTYRINKKITAFEYKKILIICFYEVESHIINETNLCASLDSIEKKIENEVEIEKNQIEQDKLKQDKDQEKIRKHKEEELRRKIENSYTLKIDRETNIFYFIEYETTKIYRYGTRILNPNYGEKENQIIKLKNGSNSAANYFYERMSIPLSKWNELNKKVSVTIVPSHSAGKRSSGMETVVEKICNDMGFENKVGFLERYEDIEKLSTGGNRSKAVHYASIRVSGKASNSTILLLDDVTTSGNSLLACKNILEREGYEVICLAIAKTKKYN